MKLLKVLTAALTAAGWLTTGAIWAQQNQDHQAQEHEQDVRVDVLPINLTEADFAGGETQVLIRNNTDHSVTVKGMFPKEQPMLEFAPLKISVEVGAGSQKEVPVNVVPLNETLTLAVPPVVEFDWQASAPDTEGFARDGTTLFAINQNFIVPSSPGDITIDGNLDDWEELPHEYRLPEDNEVQKDFWEGPQDASFAFGTALDEQALYLAVQVTDDKVLVPDLQDVAYDADAIQIQIDPRTEPARSLGQGLITEEQESFTTIILEPGRQIAPGDPETGVRVVSKEIENGYTLEARVPREVLRRQGQEELTAFRLNIAVDDIDTRDDPVTTLWWNPDWRTPQNRPGSGTFVVAQP